MPSQDVAVEIYYDGAWHDLVPDDDVYAQPITIQRGQGDESKAPRPAQITAQLNNADDLYRPSNPVSPLYGKAGRNTPVRVSVGGVVRGIAEATSWQPDQTRDFRRTPARGRAWTDIQAGGILERINGWTVPLKSPFRRYNEALTNVIGYWHGEQDRGTTTLISPTPGTRQAIFQDIAPDSQYRPPSSAPLLDFGSSDDGTTGSEMGGYFAPDPAGSTTAGWQLSWVARYGPLVAGEQDVMDWETSDGTAYGLYLNPTTGQMLIYSSKGGAPVLAFGASYGSWDWSSWTMISVDATYSAGTTTVFVNWCNADNSLSGFITTSFADQPARLDNWNASRFAGVPDGSTMGHVIGVKVGSSGGTNLFNTARRTAWAGYLGERASSRIARLCDEFGISYVVGTAVARSTPLGVQPTATLAELFRQIATTDDGLLFDARNDLRLVYFSRADRYRLGPFTIQPSDLPALPKETFDNQGIFNTVTVNQEAGGEYTVSDDTGPLGTQTPPNGINEQIQTVDVNVADEVQQLPQEANWWLKRGTVDLPRFPKLTVNLAALDPADVARIEGIEVGSVIEIAGVRENTIRLHVLGYTETIGITSRVITFVCRPDQQFQVGQWDATDSRWDSLTHTLKAEASTTATTVTFRSLSSKVMWSTTGVPYDVFISGERLTVTAMGAPALVGGGYDQVATVARSVNGIVKTLPSGSPIHAVTPGRWAI